MKKLGIVSIIIFLGVAGWVTNFYYKNLRGAGPAIKPPSKAAINTTDLPLLIPEGFSISIFVKDIPNARVLAWDPSGNLFVSSPATGKVFSVSPTGETSVVVDGLNKPHGIAFHDGKLYVAETDGVSVNKKKIIDLPGGGNHFSRTIGFGPDGRLYISVGSSCNVCVEKDWRRASMLVANADGSDLKEYAKGLRNSVFFVWHPVTKKLWATDMGRDLLGDNTPREDVNIIEEGRDYGWPYCYENRVHDDNFDPKKTHRCDVTIPPQISFQAHSAPLGLAFIPDSWPAEYRGDLLVSYHGSWNRTEPTGYKVVRFDLDGSGKSKGESDFLSGFLEGDDASGRPVDLLFDTQDSLFISDDKGE